MEERCPLLERPDCTPHSHQATPRSIRYLRNRCSDYRAVRATGGDWISCENLSSQIQCLFVRPLTPKLPSQGTLCPE
ncbi:hypothetical protein RvY_14779 [Ramazzottius varieornatus]|uniref:Uncharacterized protein n=1 Tax=Ramazzottius varieornatus TaxID=947166 RepID=A0A1D1VSL6_RAMVA|nr:hypothetical protein RvY_14779 [Ramazzottius varieornatus]